MKLDTRCIKCGSSKYYTKSTLIPEKDSALKFQLGKYYLKICMECGFTELYNAAIVNKEQEKIKNELPNPEV